jgi:ATP-dependent HslUV protease ATP-binding subunit HslU
VEVVREEAAKRAEERIVDILTDKAVDDEQPAARVAARGAAPAKSATAVTALQAGTSVSLAPKASTAPARRRRQQARKLVAERLARNELDEQIIEIELEPEEAYTSVFEFVAGMTSEDVGDGFQEFLSSMPGGRRRSRQVSVKEARRLLTQEEANKLIDFDQVVEQATRRVEQSGVIFLDEIDKIVGSKVDMGPDVSGEGVQRDLLPIVEGSTVMTRFGPVKTDHILWIAAGAFHSARPSDLLPELQGRLPLRVELESLTEADFRRILTQPENSLTRQYQALMSVEEVQLEFTEDGIAEIARCAQRMNERVENIGARRLHTVIEKVLEDVSFRAPELSGQSVVVDAAFVHERLDKVLADEDLSRYIL